MKLNILIKEWTKILGLIFVIAVIFNYWINLNLDLYSLPWFLLFCAISILSYRRLRLNTNFFAIVFIPLFTIGLLIALILDSNTEKTFPFSPQYFGVYNFTEKGTDDNGITVGQKNCLKVYDISELNYITQNLNESEGIDFFIFWQTAVANDYNAEKIKYFEKNNNYLNKALQFLTIGISSFFEKVLLSLKYFIVGIISFLIFTFFYKILNKYKLSTLLIPITIDEIEKNKNYR